MYICIYIYMYIYKFMYICISGVEIKARRRKFPAGKFILPAVVERKHPDNIIK